MVVAAVEPESGSGNDRSDGERRRESRFAGVTAIETEEEGGKSAEKEAGSGKLAVLTAARQPPYQERKDHERNRSIVELDRVKRQAERGAIPERGNAAGVDNRPGHSDGRPVAKSGEESSDAVNGEGQGSGGSETIGNAEQRQAFRQ